MQCFKFPSPTRQDTKGVQPVTVGCMSFCMLTANFQYYCILQACTEVHLLTDSRQLDGRTQQRQVAHESRAELAACMCDGGIGVASCRLMKQPCAELATVPPQYWSCSVGVRVLPTTPERPGTNTPKLQWLPSSLS